MLFRSRIAAEAADVAGLADQGDGRCEPDTAEVLERVTVRSNERGELALELRHALVESLDLESKIADAAGGGMLSETLAEADLLQPPQHALGRDVRYRRLGLRVDLRPDGAQPLDRVGSARDRLAAVRLEQRDRADERRLERWTELVAVAQDDERSEERRVGKECRL